MEDKRKIQIAENKFPLIESTEHNTFLQTTYTNYINFCESLCPNFFTGNNTEVQRNIIRNNFGLTDEDILSWGPRASRYQMTPECFAFFLHSAIYSAVEGYAAAELLTTERRNLLATSIAEHVTKMDELQEKAEEYSLAARRRFSERTPEKETKKGNKKHKSKKDKKKKKPQRDSDSDFIYQYDSNSDDLLDQTIDGLKQKAADEIVPTDNQYRQYVTFPTSSALKPAGFNVPHVDQSIVDVIMDTPVTKPVEIPPKPQEMQNIIQPQNIVTDSTKSSNKNKKSNKNLIQKVITGHKPTDVGPSRVRDILVYDVPVSWTPEEILKQLTLWENLLLCKRNNKENTRQFV